MQVKYEELKRVLKMKKKLRKSAVRCCWKGLGGDLRLGRSVDFQNKKMQK
jgi:hypothetical protein